MTLFAHFFVSESHFLGWSCRISQTQSASSLGLGENFSLKLSCIWLERWEFELGKWKQRKTTGELEKQCVFDAHFCAIKQMHQMIKIKPPTSVSACQRSKPSDQNSGCKTPWAGKLMFQNSFKKRKQKCHLPLTAHFQIQHLRVCCESQQESKRGKLASWVSAGNNRREVIFVSTCANPATKKCHKGLRSSVNYSMELSGCHVLQIHIQLLNIPQSTVSWQNTVSCIQATNHQVQGKGLDAVV